MRSHGDFTAPAASRQVCAGRCGARGHSCGAAKLPVPPHRLVQPIRRRQLARPHHSCASRPRRALRPPPAALCLSQANHFGPWGVRGGPSPEYQTLTHTNSGYQSGVIFICLAQTPRGKAWQRVMLWLPQCPRLAPASHLLQKHLPNLLEPFLSRPLYHCLSPL